MENKPSIFRSKLIVNMISHRNSNGKEKTLPEHGCSEPLNRIWSGFIETSIISYGFHTYQMLCLLTFCLRKNYASELLNRLHMREVSCKTEKRD